MHVAQYSPIQSFLDYLRFEKRYSQHTLLSYQNDLEQFFAFLTQYDSLAIEAITATYIRSWLAEHKRLKALLHEIHQLTVSLLRARARLLRLKAGRS